MSNEPPQKKRKCPEKTPCLPMKTRKEIETRTGTALRCLYSTAITIPEMLALAGYSLDKKGLEAITTVKHEVYKELVRYLRVAGYESLMGPNACGVVLFIIIRIIDEFMQQTGCHVQLVPGKLIVESGENGEYEEFISHHIKLMEGRDILIVEVKRGSSRMATSGCLLEIKKMAETLYHGGVVYGFITNGVAWKMLRYDSIEGNFLSTYKIETIFDTMGSEKDRWLSSFSCIVNCVYAALSDGAGSRVVAEYIGGIILPLYFTLEPSRVSFER